ncbi:MAG: calcineurin-like phosphoesterase C-terminal domain-containing protein [Candidatus Cryptobacteroides sp.]
MKIIRILSCCITAAVLIASCGKDEGPAPIVRPGGGDKTEENPSDGDNDKEDGKDWCGTITDTDGNPIKGVTVSDGYSCTVTDDKGVYQLSKISDKALRINISLPAEYEVPIENGLPCFWQEIKSGQTQYDFKLAPLKSPETNFYLYCLADPQCQNATRHTKRFINESVPDLKAYVDANNDLPAYGITLGDIGYNTQSIDYNKANSIFSIMKLAMSNAKTGIPLFQIMGNHDNSVIAGNTTYNAENDIKMEEAFANAFGPVNYSFNRGNAHIVAMDDILATDPETVYGCGFRDDQLEWLKQDLSYVSKDKLLILCVHIPLYSNTSKQNVSAVLELCNQFAECHIMSGHTHKMINSPKPGSRDKIYEHTHAAVCGAWWHSTINTDGAPNGYGIYKVEGNHISEWKYKGVDRNETEQIRMYRGNLPYMDGYGTQFWFAATGAGDIWANIWNWDSNWTVDVYEDGAKTGSMTRQSSGDAWAAGYHIGVVGRSNSSTYNPINITHMFKYTLKNASCANVEIRATDGNGRTFTCNKFTSNTRTDFPMAPGDNY